MTNKKPLQKNLFAWFIGLSIAPMLLLLALSLPFAKGVLKDNAARILVQTAQAKASFIVNWFDYRFKDLDYQAQNPFNNRFLETLVEGLQQSQTSPANFIKSYDWVRSKTPYEERYLNLTRKYRYIYDIFLIDLNGNILYTVTQGTDLGSNLLSGRYNQTLFARSVRETLNSGRSLFSGIERYNPSNQALAGFLTAPLLDDDGNKTGVLAIQIKLDQLYQQVASTATSLDGQTSQHHYLADNNGFLLSHFNDQAKILKVKAPLYNLTASQQAQTSDEIALSSYIGLNQQAVFGYQTAINIGNIHWQLFSEIDQSEALSSANEVQLLALGLLLTLALLAALIATIQAKRIVQPLLNLSEAIDTITKGKADTKVKVYRDDEIGALANNFNKMIVVREQYIATIKENTTEIQHALNELSEQKFAIDQHSIVATTSLDGTITYVNELFCQISGYSKDELIGNNHRLLNSGHHPIEFFEQLYKTISAGNVWKNDIRNQAKNGRIYWVSTTIVPIRDASGTLCSYIAIRNDITHTKNIELKLQQAAKNSELANVAKSEFLANMSHEIRTPLNGVIGMNNLLLNSGLEPEQYNRSKIVANSANALLSIINDILDFSKIEAGKLDIEIIDFELSTLISDIGSTMAFKAEEAQVDFICPSHPIPTSWFQGDPGRIRQILVNLISNAIKFTSDGEVSVNVQVIEPLKGETLLVIDVIDDGIGLSFEQQQNLFERFTQADGSTTRKYGGTGLGLTISKQLVELMHGEINVRSALHEGATFSISLPMQASEQIAAPELADNLDNQSVLIVDDNQTNRLLLMELLNLWGVSNQQVSNAADAIQTLSQAAASGSPFSIAIIDMQMPIMDGQELARVIHQQSNIAKTKLVMLTSQAQRGDAQKVQNSGINAFLSKPVNQSDLYNALLQVTGQGNDKRLITRHTVHENAHFKAKVLVVEDNITNQLVARGMLEELGIEVDILANGKEACEALISQAYDLIFMDCQMPIMDGFEATRQIRDKNSTVLNRDIAIVAMTANVMAEDKAHCYDSGMDDFIAKPVQATALRAVLTKWLNNPQKEAAHTENSTNFITQDELDFEASKKVQREEKKEETFDPTILHQLLNDKEQVASIINAFISELPSQLIELKSALINEDAETAAALAHKIKGSSSSIGANALAMIAHKLEVSAKNKKIPPLEKALAELKEEFASLQKHI